MDDAFSDLIAFWKNPSITETLVDVLLCAVPIWLAVAIGLVIGWSWRPRWTGLVFLGLRRSKLRFLWTAPPGFGARRLWFAFTAISAFSVCRSFWSRGKSGISEGSPASQRDGDDDSNSISSGEPLEGEDLVTENDLDHLLHLLEGKDMEWQPVMERSTSNMTYQAWRHESQTRPTIYRSRTIYEDATPELVRDFFWDDDFRLKWDPMLVYFKILEEFPHTGTMIVHWIKKFPFFCSDREYIIGRRIWEAGKTYYCVTKGVPYPGLPKRDKPRRVELYFSSWIIRPFKSRKGDGQVSACEVTLLHYEDMGIPKDVANLGVRHGMWGTVKKIHLGLRAYQTARKNEPLVSRSALMARITTKISLSPEFSESEPICQEEDGDRTVDIERDNNLGVDWKWIVVGGVVTILCGLRSEAIAKGVLLGTWPRITRRWL